METPVSDTHMISVDDAALRGWPLPMPSSEGDKEQRGHVLILGGSREMPGAVILAATAALRAGAGKLTIATGASVAQLVALALPEARVIGLERALLPRLEGAAVVLDACAMGIIRKPEHGAEQAPFRFAQAVIVTPHAGEMAHLTGLDKQAIGDDADATAAQAARDWNAVVALKGARTVICAPDGGMWQHEGGNVGLASSGSGDVLAGIIAGLAARGASLAQATCWGVALHARAGERLAQRMGLLGYIARELPDEIPALLEAAAGA